MFDLNYQLCKEFPAFTPVIVDDLTFFDVVDLYSDVVALRMRSEKNSSDDGRVIRKPAGDDWF